MSKNKCVEQPLPKCVACEVDPMFDHECSSFAPAFWNGLSLSFVARLRVVDAERAIDGSWSTMVDGMRVHLASSDDQFRELVDKAVVWSKAQTAPVWYPPGTVVAVKALADEADVERCRYDFVRGGQCALDSGHLGPHMWTEHEPTNPECPVCKGACDYDQG